MTIFTNKLFIYTIFFTGVILVYSSKYQQLKETDSINVENDKQLNFLYFKSNNNYSNIQDVEPNPPEPRDDLSNEST